MAAFRSPVCFMNFWADSLPTSLLYISLLLPGPVCCHTLSLRSARRAILGSPLSAHDWMTYTTTFLPHLSPALPRERAGRVGISSTALHVSSAPPSLGRGESGHKFHPFLRTDQGSHSISPRPSLSFMFVLWKGAGFDSQASLVCVGPLVGHPPGLFLVEASVSG